MTKAAIAAVTKAGFIIIAAIADNRINRNMFTELCGGILKPCIPNPFNTNIPLFLMFDSVHILKVLRNIWLNQKTKDTTLFFPSFENFDEIMEASFDDLRNIHYSEKNEIVKMAPKLNEKALFPSSVERQNVNLCLRIFHESNMHALTMLDEVKYKGTITFLHIIIKWWKIASIKNTRKGYEKLDHDSVPFSCVNDARIKFLSCLSSWLKEWQKKEIPGFKRNQGKLTSETFFAFQHTVQALTDVIKYLISEKKDKFVLTGKFQTDNLEGRFGQYRQLNGGNYNLSVDQVLKSEKKLRITSLLKLRSESYGEMPISDFMADFSEKIDTEQGNDMEENNYKFELKGFVDNIQFENEEDIPQSIYISGYAVHQLKKKLHCSSCIKMLSTEKSLVLENDNSSHNYFNLVEKGGLMYPNEFTTRVFLLCLKVFKCVLKRDNEHLLLTDNVKKILTSMTYDKVVELYVNQCCPSCGEGTHDLSLKCISIFFNIFLSNYSKVKNNVVHSSCQKRKYDMLMASIQ
nr:uncharacterized protein LOC110282455 [Parasteatoda tepidariorum]